MHTLAQLTQGELKGSKHVKLACGLSTFPLEILDLSDTLEILDLSHNHLSSLPEDFDKLQKLKIAFFSDNDFTELPAVLGKCKNLEMIGFKSNKIKTVSEESLPAITRWLILTNNQISIIPKSIGKCHRLQKLALAGNSIKELPAEMQNCNNLELIRISANLLQQMPPWLLQLPKLSWIAYAGNPCSEMEQISNTLAEIDWAELQIQEQLGQGASGIISKAWMPNTQMAVAVKVFKGEMTSDGSPVNEMNACLAAGSHPHLIDVLGKIKNHPQQNNGLVMSLIPPHFSNLGNPPSLQSCSRDVFDANTNFSLQQVLKIAKGIASVCIQLHSSGINHGDLYAHNILFDGDGNHLLGDFGAATFYNTQSEEAEAIQKIEIRAYGCLLDDLLSNLQQSDAMQNSIKMLTQLRNNCLHTNVLFRPTFQSIEELLKDL